MMKIESSILIILLFVSNTLAAESYKSRIYRAYVNNDMQEWELVLNEMEANKNNKLAFLEELINFQYGYIGYCLISRYLKKARKHLEQAESNLDKMEQLDYVPSAIAAYQSAFYGYKIGLSPWKSPILGPKSKQHAERAILLDPKNPFGYVQSGNVYLHMPPVFGGSTEKAIEYFLKAKELMKRNKAMWVDENWNYLSLLVLIGQSYEAIGNYKEALAQYHEALTREPNVQVIKNDLLPKLKNTTKNE